jgi:hypothetical protein
MGSRVKAILAAVGLGLAAISAPAAAAIVWFPPVTSFEDDDLDFLINNVGSPNTLDVGDTLVTVFEIQRTFGVFGGGPANIGPGQELTGIAAIDVVSAVPTGTPGLFNYTFAPHAAGLNALLPVASAVPGGAAGGGAIAAAWLDNNPNLQLVPPNCATLADCTARASDGTLWQVDGFNGDPNEFWAATNARADLGAVRSLPASTKVATVNFGLNVLFNGTGQNLGPQACAICPPGGDNAIDVIGSGDVLGGQGLPASLFATGAFARSDFDFQKATVSVPEPSVLALLATLFLGLGVTRRGRRE